MHGWQWGAWVIGMLIGLFLIRYGIRFNKQKHEQNSIADYHTGTDLTDGLLGCLFSIVFDLILGLILKLLPWWMVKFLILLVGFAVTLGLLAFAITSL